MAERPESGSHDGIDCRVDVAHVRRDQEKLRLHRAVVEHLRADPERVLRMARANLERWIARNGPQPYYLEWQEILESHSVEEIISLLLTDGDRAQHLRQTAPFAGVLSDSERDALLRKR